MFLRPHMFLIVAIIPLIAGTMFAQSTTYFPDVIYPGDNVITVSDANGIETIAFTASPHTRVEILPIKGCPKKVNVRVNVDDATTSETVDLRVNNCKGEFSTKSFGAENWSMRQERMPLAIVGRDTCLTFNLTTTHETTIDSIYVDNPDMYVRMPAKIDGTWLATHDAVFHYNVCYHPLRAEKISTTLRIRVLRDQPNEGLTHYVVNRSILAASVLPAAPKKRDSTPVDTRPPVTDPTTFQNIVMPTAESIGDGKLFVADYDVAGVLIGYGITSKISLLAGGVYVPAFISEIAAALMIAKVEVLTVGKISGALGGVLAYTTSPTSDITTEALFGVVSYGDKRNRFSMAAGYSWKHHVTPTDNFHRNAVVITAGGDVTITRGWKLAAEGYYIESSGLAPGAIAAKYFTDNFAITFGFGINFAGSANVTSSGLTGSIKSLPFAPIIAVAWVW